MQSPSQRFGSHQYFLSKICKEKISQIYRDLHGDAMLEHIRMGSNMAAGNQEKHLSLRFATKAGIYLSRNSRVLI